MTNISIFAKPAFLNTASNTPFISKEKSYKGNGHLQRVSSMIRGDQIAEYLGAKYNPEKGYEKDVCIYVKPHVPSGYDFQFEGKRSYLDIVDGWGLVSLLQSKPDIGVIACSIQDQFKLKKVLSNKVVFIPQHHCNYENLKRARKGIKTVGIIGTNDAFDWIPTELKECLSEKGIELLEYSKFFSRQDIIDFYMKIDVQLIWRPYRMKLSNPLKMVNASSFGIPTIAYEESVFNEEFAGLYYPCQNLTDFSITINSLINFPLVYEDLSKKLIEKSKDYHISEVEKLYKQL